MLETIVWIGICVAAGIACYFAGRRRGDDKGYWRGRGEGWKSCETMIMERAQELPQYDHSQLWTDLIQ